MNKTTKTAIGIVVLILIVWGLSSLSKKSATPVAGEPIKIGAIYAMTGPAAKFGELSILGVRDAARYFEESTGRVAEVVVEDSASDPKTGVSAVSKLFTADGVKFVVTGTSAVSAAIAPVAEQNNLFLISDAALLGLTKGKHYTLQNFMPSLVSIPDQINENVEWKKVAVVYINDEFGGVWQENIRDGLDGGKTVQTFSFEKTTTEYRTGATKIKQFSPDVLVVIGYGPALNQVLADITLNKIESPRITYLACTLPGVLTDGRFSLEGQYSYEYPSIQNETIKSWTKEQGRNIDTFYAVAFENTLLTLTAAENGSSDPDKAIDYLKNNSVQGLWGDVKFNQDGVVNRDLVATKIQSGKCVPLEN